MKEYILKIPQLGETIHTVTVLQYFKNEGDVIEEDELLMSVETDKATMDIESPVSGKIVKLIKPIGSSVGIGESIIHIELNKTNLENGDISHPNNQEYISWDGAEDDLYSLLKETRNKGLSPRAKEFCKKNKVIPINIYKNSTVQLSPTKISKTGIAYKTESYYTDIALSQNQIKLAQVLGDATKQVVSANIQSYCDYKYINNYKKNLRKAENTNIPSVTEIIAWSVVTSLRNHPKFRSRLFNNMTLREFANPNIGIAVSLPDDDLTTAVIDNVFSFEFSEFIQEFRIKVKEAREGFNYSTYHSIVISDLSMYRISSATPIVVHPASSTLFVGKQYFNNSSQFLNLSLSFDHRFINGAGAAKFLNEIQNNVIKTCNIANT